MTQAPCPFQSVGARSAACAVAVCLTLAGFLSGCASKGPPPAFEADVVDPTALSAPLSDSAEPAAIWLAACCAARFQVA